MLVCPNCEIEYEEGKFCTACGTVLIIQEPKEERLCSNCGTPYETGQRFCTNCGIALAISQRKSSIHQGKPEKEVYAEFPKERGLSNYVKVFIGVIVLLLLIGGGIYVASNYFAKPDSVGMEEVDEVIGLKAVWNPPSVVWTRMQDECRARDGEYKFVECVASIMQESGASSQAIEFARLIKGEGYMTSFRDMGKVDLVEVFYPFRANDNGSYLLVNGIPKVIDVNDWDNQKNIDIRNDPLYPSLIERFPKLQLWGHAGFKEMQLLAGGGQRFIFALVLLNGCHACEIGGYAYITYDFDSYGKFLGTSLLKLTEAQPANQPDARKIFNTVMGIFQRGFRDGFEGR